MSTYVTTLDRRAPMTIQPREGFVCPSWCVSTHSAADISQSDEGLWIVNHLGKTHSWWTSRGTEMRARLRFDEYIGNFIVPVDDVYYGPMICLEGDDGSAYMGIHEIDAADVAQWGAMLITLGAEVLP